MNLPMKNQLGDDGLVFMCWEKGLGPLQKIHPSKIEKQRGNQERMNRTFPNLELTDFSNRKDSDSNFKILLVPQDLSMAYIPTLAPRNVGFQAAPDLVVQAAYAKLPPLEDVPLEDIVMTSASIKQNTHSKYIYIYNLARLKRCGRLFGCQQLPTVFFPDTSELHQKKQKTELEKLRGGNYT